MSKTKKKKGRRSITDKQQVDDKEKKKGQRSIKNKKRSKTMKNKNLFKP